MEYLKDLPVPALLIVGLMIALVYLLKALPTFILGMREAMAPKDESGKVPVGPIAAERIAERMGVMGERQSATAKDVRRLVQEVSELTKFHMASLKELMSNMSGVVNSVSKAVSRVSAEESKQTKAIEHVDTAISHLTKLEDRQTKAIEKQSDCMNRLSKAILTQADIMGRLEKQFALRTCPISGLSQAENERGDVTIRVERGGEGATPKDGPQRRTE